MKTIHRMVHSKCRLSPYPLSQVVRFALTDEQVPWSVTVQNYSPHEYESPVLFNKPWADPTLSEKFNPKWNEIDGDINRKSHTGPYNIVDGRPLNPDGRTGLKGRGILGKWGPNHAADPIVTRWKNEIHQRTKLPILQFCAIQRRDCDQWAIPGGMVDPGEKVSETLKREFMEEAFNSKLNNEDEKKKNQEIIESFFKAGEDVYKGYVDDPRNTDNAWMETVAVNFHDENNTVVGKFDLHAGDDAKNVRWIDIDEKLDLYASHSNFIRTVAQLRGAHW